MDNLPANNYLFDPLELAMVNGDLSKLSTEQRAQFYLQRCESLGLDPNSSPFQYLMLQNRLVLYATKGLTEQLRTKRGISLNITARELLGDVYQVSCRATLADGRTDEATGAVCLTGLKGDALANAYMKAETKAKRRVTLSVCGLGILDESEIETIQDARTFSREQAERPKPNLSHGGTYPAVKQVQVSQPVQTVQHVQAEPPQAAKQPQNNHDASSFDGVMPVGKHKGKMFSELSDKYLEWAYEQADLMEKIPELKKYIDASKGVVHAETWDDVVEAVNNFKDEEIPF